MNNKKERNRNKGNTRDEVEKAKKISKEKNEKTKIL